MLSAGTPRQRIAVLVADPDVLTCRLLASRLRKHKLFEVTECPASPADVLSTARRVRPSVAVLGPVFHGAPSGTLGGVREMRTALPSLRIVLLLERTDRGLVVEAFRAGVRGVFVRSEYEFGALCKCVHRVHQGHVWANTQQLDFVLEAFASGPASHKAERSNGTHLVSRRESDIVRLVVEGLSNREIADRLKLSEHTVKNYIFRVFDKLGVSNRIELVHYALAHREVLVDTASKSICA